MIHPPRSTGTGAEMQINPSGNGFAGADHAASSVRAPHTGSFSFVCPRCGSVLEATAADQLICPVDRERFTFTDGIWRFLLPERQAYFQPFIDDYETIRAAEGRGSADPVYFQFLPDRDITGRFANDWRIRARSYHVLFGEVLRPMELRLARPLAILDLGAGNCWLANRLAQRGHKVAAVDLIDNAFDGLGCARHYSTEFVPVQAEYEHLPFAADQFDLVIFNGSIHYATDYTRTLVEVLRILSPDGQVVIMDSPVYQNESSGRQMIREREEQFERQYGFPSNRLPSEGFLTETRLRELELNLGLNWQFIPVWYGARWALRPWKARILGRREPARFLLIVGRRSAAQESEQLTRTRRIMRKLARTWLAGRYRLTQRHRHRNLTLELIGESSIVVLPDVFNPVLLRSGAFLAESLAHDVIPVDSTVLDMGTGTGIGAIAAAGRARRVLAVDINPDAVRCARINALINRVEDRIEVREGDLFELVGDERFDAVLFNPPYYTGEAGEPYDHAWRSIDTMERFATELRDHLTSDGCGYLVLSSDGDSARFLERFRRAGYRIEIVNQRDLSNEVFTMYRIQVEG